MQCALHVTNRVHSVNLALRSDRIFIHFENCQNLIKDLEQVTWDEGQIKKSENPLLTHLSDALGYLIHYLYPFKPKVKAGMGKKRIVALIA
ncbi:MAG: hypothetical protein RMY64_25585 [Nostoc sp. DedQUE08]|uniref:hypothetical protein n=1 Tax=Nostoc sp. DedQUE08 TaxID=3075393 RepID=UPI002AD255DD|nr:hypothetical protein [Nostoc sp. DedQUE08]MDZ8068967.1 hypothetical protein [Nostoc sp. DedQUE08]